MISVYRFAHSKLFLGISKPLCKLLGLQISYVTGFFQGPTWRKSRSHVAEHSSQRQTAGAAPFLGVLRTRPGWGAGSANEEPRTCAVRRRAAQQRVEGRPHSMIMRPRWSPARLLTAPGRARPANLCHEVVIHSKCRPGEKPGGVVGPYGTTTVRVAARKHKPRPATAHYAPPQLTPACPLARRQRPADSALTLSVIAPQERPSW